MALLCGILLATSCVSGGVLVGDGVNLLLVAVWPAEFRLRRSDPCSAGLRSVLGFRWILSCADVALRTWNTFQITDTTLASFGWVSYAVAI
jgi:hypothetical protein